MTRLRPPFASKSASVCVLSVSTTWCTSPGLTCRSRCSSSESCGGGSWRCSSKRFRMTGWSAGPPPAGQFSPSRSRYVKLAEGEEAQRHGVPVHRPTRQGAHGRLHIFEDDEDAGGERVADDVYCYGGIGVCQSAFAAMAMRAPAMHKIPALRTNDEVGIGCLL